MWKPFQPPEGRALAVSTLNASSARLKRLAFADGLRFIFVCVLYGMPLGSRKHSIDDGDADGLNKSEQRQAATEGLEIFVCLNLAGWLDGWWF